MFLWEQHFLNCSAKFWKCEWHWEDPHSTSFHGSLKLRLTNFLFFPVSFWHEFFLSWEVGEMLSPLYFRHRVEDTREITDLAPFPGSLECCSRSLTATCLLHAALCLLPEWTESLLHHLWYYFSKINHRLLSHSSIYSRPVVALRLTILLHTEG